jgi:hypothetical protein
LPAFFPVLLCAQTLVPSGQMTGTPSKGEYYHTSSLTLTNGFHFTASPGNSFRAYISGKVCVPLQGQASADHNYVVTYTPRKAGVGDPTNKDNNACDVMQTIAYFDGLGRPLQTVQVKGSPSGLKDVIQPVAYYQYGREATKYLPYTTDQGIPGSYRANAITEQATAVML